MDSEIRPVEADRPRPARRPGMGAVPGPGGTAFRVWAPHATRVAVAGDFNGWSETQDPLAPEGRGYWSAEVAGAGPGGRYCYVIDHAGQRFSRRDPYARQLDHSNGPSVIVDPHAFAWGDDERFRAPPWHELVIYEMHVGTFNDVPGGAPGDLTAAIGRLAHVADLGANAVQIMPLQEFPGDFSWGYNPASAFAIESRYGGYDAVKAFVKAAHALGLAVLIDVVYNHLGPDDLVLWQFDGWHEPGKGGIYFYNDWRSRTPWTESGRPDYGRGEVRQYLRDSALYWLEELHADGLRWDMTLYIRTVDGNEADPGQTLPDGWSLMQWINREIDARYPWKISIAEDLQDNPWLTVAAEDGGAAFDAQWAANFVHPVRRTLIAPRDEDRSMAALRDAILGRYGGTALTRVLYTESHDEVANGKARLPSEIAPDDPGGWFARKRSTLGAALVLTAPGIPMLFQGQEFLEDEWFRDADPLDWSKTRRFAGILALYRDLIRLRRNWNDRSRGLTGQGVNVFHLNDRDKVLAFHRWDRGGPGDDVVVVLNCANRAWDAYRIGLPRGGGWQVVLNSDGSVYSPDFGNHPGHPTTAEAEPRDGLGFSGTIGFGPYTCLVLTQRA
ncbi:MAG: alpha amylase C-terminal domain-containing protein [Methylobacterium sp.]|uniref:alpha-amylase family glycosyl hydrolase n=1 Tax=Methylobacterium sp. TaxID=409 RepID=UPI00258BD5FA|nr:alpha-amylase family glycosyl hydrolase [Methylobacterium sp.]MBY0297047.1 alpha amylase C-terminal domain-containing protein [Methylobacterium sp.]